MHRLEDLALITVGRGCGFAALAILTFMFGLSADWAIAFKAGGMLSLIVCLTLIVKAWHAPTKPYKQTELWMMLSPDERPKATLAQGLVGDALQRSYLRFAQHAALVASGLLLATLVIQGARTIS